MSLFEYFSTLNICSCCGHVHVQETNAKPIHNSDLEIQSQTVELCPGHVYISLSSDWSMSRHRNFWLASIWQWLHDPSLHQLHLWRKKRERELGECQGTHFGGNSIHWCFVSISNQTQTKYNTTLHWLARSAASILMKLAHLFILKYTLI